MKFWDGNVCVCDGNLILDYKIKKWVSVSEVIHEAMVLDWNISTDNIFSENLRHCCLNLKRKTTYKCLTGKRIALFIFIFKRKTFHTPLISLNTINRQYCIFHYPSTIWKQNWKENLRESVTHHPFYVYVPFHSPFHTYDFIYQHPDFFLRLLFFSLEVFSFCIRMALYFFDFF